MKKILFETLSQLTDLNSAFIQKDYQLDTVDGIKYYKIFKYRMATYQDFCMNGALECRGITFEISKDGEFIDLVSRPLTKFFNIGENLATENINLSKVTQIMSKLDGSLISTFLLPSNNIGLKTKGTLHWDRLGDVYKCYNLKHPVFREIVRNLVMTGHTVNMEYTAPTNQIVVKYDFADLTILNVRNNRTGHVLDISDIAHFAQKDEHVISAYSAVSIDTIDWDANDVKHHFEALEETNNIEGCVIQYLDDNNILQYAKYKTKWYLERHRMIDPMSSIKSIYELAINSELDDIRSLFVDNKEFLERLENMEIELLNYLRDREHEILNFFDTYKDEDVATYCQRAHESLPFAHVAVMMYKNSEGHFDFDKFWLREQTKYNVLKRLKAIGK